MKILLLFLLQIPLFAWSQSNFDKGQKLFAQNKFVEAKPYFEKETNEHPNNLAALEYLGDIYGHTQNWNNAILYYDKLKKLKPNEANYYYKYGGALGMKAKDGGPIVALGIIGDMKKSFEKAIELNPKHIDARWALIEYYLQLPGFVGGSERKAQKFASELFALSPVDGYLAKGHIDEYFERYKKAEINYKKAVEVGGSKTTYERLAELYKYKLHQPEKAKAAIEEYTRKNQL